MCLQVNLRDGKKEGEGLILRKNGTPYMSLQFIHDSIEGEVKRFDEFNWVIFKGNVNDGKETGVFTEYDKEGKIIWMGYYMDGYQYITMTKSTKMPGYYEEKSRAGDLMGVSHYDETKLIRDGLSYEYKNGKVHRVCMYSNGSFVRVVMEMSGPTLTEYDDNGKKVYEGGYCRRLAEGPTKRLRCGVSGPPSSVPRLLEEREEEGDEGAETARSRETESVSLSVMRLLAADHNWRVIGHSSGHGHHRAEIDSGSDRFKLRPIGVHFREAKLVPKSGAGFGTRLRLVRPESLRFPPNTRGWRK